MKQFFFFCVICSIISCSSNEANTTKADSTDTSNQADSSVGSTAKRKHFEPTIDEKVTDANAWVYANDRFKNVKVQKLNDTTFKITGKAQVFEANFEWQVKEDNV